MAAALSLSRSADDVESARCGRGAGAAYCLSTAAMDSCNTMARVRGYAGVGGDGAACASGGEEEEERSVVFEPRGFFLFLEEAGIVDVCRPSCVLDERNGWDAT